MTVLVLGASGATGKHLVRALLARGQHVKAVVRSEGRLPEDLREHPALEVIVGTALDLPEEQLAGHLRDCGAVASCLGHNLSFRGLYGSPRRLVRDSLRRLCDIAKSDSVRGTLKVVLMNTTGNRNLDLHEPVSIVQHVVLALLRALLPPHTDNEQAANYLRTAIDRTDQRIEWCAVRPDGLIDQGAVSEYTLHPSPTRSAIFAAGHTSRINVGDFMAALIVDQGLWNEWRFKMPVIYNSE